MSKKDEKFTPEQRQRIAILHEEIDYFVQSFYSKWENYIAYVEEPTPSLSHQKREKRKEKKKRHIFSIPFYMLSDEEKNSYHRFHEQMLSITDNVPVRSIENKLISFYPTGNKLSISKTFSYRTFKETYDKVSAQLGAIAALEDPHEHIEEEITALERLLSFMEKYHKPYITGKNQSDLVVYRLYDDNYHVLAEKSYFKGGVVVPEGCKILEPMGRKPRIDNKELNREVLCLGNKRYILDREVQYDNDSK